MGGGDSINASEWDQILGLADSSNYYKYVQKLKKI
jgi:hypothetical protein